MWLTPAYHRIDRSNAFCHMVEVDAFAWKIIARPSVGEENGSPRRS